MLTVAASLGVSHLVASLLQPPASPFLAVGNAAIDRTPAAVKDFAIEHFGSHDKAVLLAGMAVVLAALGAASGLLARVRVWLGLGVVVALAVLGLLAVLDRPDTTQVGVVPPLVALVVGWFVLLVLYRSAMPGPADASPRADVSRREFLGASAAVAVGAAATGYGGQLARGDAAVARSRADVGVLAAADPLPPVPAGADFTADGGEPFLTPNDRFYRVDTALSVPAITVADWSLRIHGMVDRELTLGFDDLRARRLVERRLTLTCVSNEVGGNLVGTADWVGVALRDLLLDAGVHPEADQLLSTSIDGYSAGTPTADALDRDGAMLAVNMNGGPLPAEHGFPVRLIVPGSYGYASATKWLVDLELTTFAAKRAYWVPRGYAPRAPIKTGSRIVSPGAFAVLAAGTVTVTGSAWHQGVGIGAVEVRVDEGPWQQARLGADVGDDAWRMWRADLTDVAAGSHLVEVRASTKGGETQPQERSDPLPDGSTGWPSVSFRTR